MRFPIVRRCTAIAFLVLAGVLFNSNVSAQGPVEDGTRVRVRLNWGDRYEGTLVRWSSDSLYIQPENWSGPVQLPASGLHSLDRSLGRGGSALALRHGTYGLVAGLAFGLAVSLYDQRGGHHDWGNMAGFALIAGGVSFTFGMASGYTTERWQPVLPEQVSGSR